MAPMEWQTLGAMAPTALADSRVQLHWAAQVVGACADRWIEPRGDDSHTTMEWDRERGALVGQATPAGARIALRVADLTLVIAESQLALAGRTLAEAMAWADGRLAAAASAEPRGAHARDYDLPAHPVASGAPFAPDPDALAELARWYADGDRVVRDRAALEPGATAVRCWPHHFDIASIAYLDAQPAATARQIGFGLSPGDQYHGQPYFYLTPYPIEVDVTFPPLPSGGRWHREGFIGAVLLANDLLEGGGQDRQHERAGAWLDAAFAVGRHLIGGVKR